MPLRETFYEAMLAGARPLATVAALAGGEVRKGVRGRRDTLRRFVNWGAGRRDPSRPLVWFHAPSVGEGLMAQAIIAALRERDPSIQIAFTHFSTSAERMADRVGADVWGYMPWDTRGPVRRVLDALQPSAVAFVRTEIWPVTVREAQERGARVALVNAVLSEGSGRLSWPARPFLEPAYARLDAVGAVSRDHAARFGELGVADSTIRVTGDARFDQVMERIDARGLRTYRSAVAAADSAPGRRAARSSLPEELRSLFASLWTDREFTLVAGSTWSEDEEVLVPALQSLIRGGSSPGSARVIIAPHEPTEAHLAALERRLSESGLSHSRLSMLLEGGSLDAVVVDRMGVLADLYALGDAAYVGGGFGTAGLHSVVEPAGLGLPVVFGPEQGNAREVEDLLEAGGGFVVEDASAVEGVLRRLLEEPGFREEAGAAAGGFVQAGGGAARRNASLILEAD